MRIDEVFDTPYDWRWMDGRGAAHKLASMVSAALTGGDLANAMIPDAPSKLTAKFSAHLTAMFHVSEDDDIFVMFHRSGNSWTVVFDATSNYGEKAFTSTNAGHPGRILATVLEILEEFVRKYKPDQVKFTAHDEKRARVYTVMAKKFKAFFKDYKDEIEYDYEHDETDFTFTRS